MFNLEILSLHNIHDLVLTLKFQTDESQDLGQL